MTNVIYNHEICLMFKFLKKIEISNIKTRKALNLDLAMVWNLIRKVFVICLILDKTSTI